MGTPAIGTRLLAEVMGTFLFFFLGFSGIATSVQTGGAGISALGAAYAVAVVGGAAMGAVAEKPETAGRALVFVGLAEGIAIYGLIVAIMILGYLS